MKEDVSSIHHEGAWNSQHWGVCSRTDGGERVSHQLIARPPPAGQVAKGAFGHEPGTHTHHPPPPHPGHPVSASTPAWSLCNLEDKSTSATWKKGSATVHLPPNKATAQLPGSEGSQTCQARAKPGRSTRSRKTNEPQPFWLVQESREEVCPHRLTP
jgi:hypothetical protein